MEINFKKLEIIYMPNFFKIFMMLVIIWFFSEPVTDAWYREDRPINEIFGICDHITFNETIDAKELKLIKDHGLSYVRIDSRWSQIEKNKGIYDFSKYDILIEQMKEENLRPLIILDYSNPLYEQERSVRTEEGRFAFANFATAMVRRYNTINVIWEVWNEPNWKGGWDPQPDPREYVELVKVTSQAIRSIDKNAKIIGPGTAGIDYNFIEECFKLGLLDFIDAISVHPYRRTMPEPVLSEYERLEILIHKYSHSNNYIPIIASECGYPTSWFDDDVMPGNYLVRMLLINAYAGIPLTVIYDLKNDGIDPQNKEHNFGLVNNNYSPKYASEALKKMQEALKEKHFKKRMLSDDKDFLLAFTDKDNNEFTLAVWTTDSEHEVWIPNLGEIRLTRYPQYINVMNP